MARRITRIAIKTKYLRPTSHRGARIKATAMDGYPGEIVTATKPYPVQKRTDNYLGLDEEKHRNVAMELIRPLYNPNGYPDVDIELIAGATVDGYVFVAVTV
jgi:hypothetical protein